MTAFEHVLVARQSGIGTLTLNRPEKLNAFAGQMRQEVVEAVRLLADAEDVRVLVITGAGRAFCAGADIGYMERLVETRDMESAAALVETGRAVVTTIRHTSKPVIASVNGPAAGGGANLALACDLRLASDRATIGQTFNRIGLHPDWGGTYFLPRLVGPSAALELIFSGDMIDAAEAHRLGLFNRVVPHDRLADETQALASRLAAKPPLALALAKRAIYQSGDHSLEQMLDLELEHQMRCFRSEDSGEGLRAFLEKRAPVFQGR
ncbi:MAG TPA: enoyl-CoA hydratase [Gemmatimonadales bacterium]|nr:enoyl-CoA hydratase [Gemmatimonadales bacterium]